MHKAFSTARSEEDGGGDNGESGGGDGGGGGGGGGGGDGQQPPHQQHQQQQPHHQQPPEDLLYGIDHLEDVDTQWGNFVASLDPNRDVILFPGARAISANEFPWGGEKRSDGECIGLKREKRNANMQMCVDLEQDRKTKEFGLERLESLAERPEGSSVENVEEGIVTTTTATKPSSSSTRWRLVVLESNWINGKTIFNQLNKYREIKQLPPLRTVILHDLQGQYWRFHEEGLLFVVCCSVSLFMLIN